MRHVGQGTSGPTATTYNHHHSAAYHTGNIDHHHNLLLLYNQPYPYYQHHGPPHSQHIHRTRQIANESRQPTDAMSSSISGGELLKELPSYYDFSLGCPKDGFGPFVVKCLEHGIDVYSFIFRHFHIPRIPADNTHGSTQYHHLVTHPLQIVNKPRQHRDDKPSTRDIGNGNERTPPPVVFTYINSGDNARTKNETKKRGRPRQNIKIVDQEMKSFYSSGTINTNEANASDRLADKYQAEFKSMSKEKVDVLELLKSLYNYELHIEKEGFDEVMVQCLDCGLESRHMNWYLRLHGQYSSFPFIGNSTEDFLLKRIVTLTCRKKTSTVIQRKRGAHLITGRRTTEEATKMTAHLFKQLDMKDPMKQAEEVFVKLPDMLCYDESKYKDPFDSILDR